LALTKERKEELVAQYESWLQESEAIVLTEYTGLNMTQIDELRSKVREAGGEFHVLKNTLAKRAFANVGWDAPEDYFIGSTAIGVALEDPPGIAKAIADTAKDLDFIKIKGGFMGAKIMSSEEIKTLAELPPLPVMQAQLLGVLMAPASKLSRLLAEPSRQLAQVIRAHSDRGEAAAAPA
jgi:large subunit ribosomal protein L10